jgi:hypothetical protein
MPRKRLGTEEISDLALRARHGTESDRVKAVTELVEEFRSQIGAYRKNASDEIDPLLLQTINEFGLRIFAEDNPALAVERLLGKNTRGGGDIAAPKTSEVERKLKDVSI